MHAIPPCIADHCAGGCAERREHCHDGEPRRPSLPRATHCRCNEKCKAHASISSHLHGNCRPQLGVQHQRMPLIGSMSAMETTPSRTSIQNSSENSLRLRAAKTAATAVTSATPAATHESFPVEEDELGIVRVSEEENFGPGEDYPPQPARFGPSAAPTPRARYRTQPGKIRQPLPPRPVPAAGHCAAPRIPRQRSNRASMLRSLPPAHSKAIFRRKPPPAAERAATLLARRAVLPIPPAAGSRRPTTPQSRCGNRRSRDDIEQFCSCARPRPTLLPGQTIVVDGGAVFN